VENQVQHYQQEQDIDFSPYLKFMYALNAPESRRQYPRRLQVFLDFLRIDCLTVEEKSNKLDDLITVNGRDWLENQLIKFFTIQNQRAERNEISTETIRNYYKPIKLFCDMNGILINWKLISKGIKKGNRHSDDRPPTVEEIKKLLDYPDRRIKPIVLIMLSSGIRVSSWDYLKWKDISEIKKDTITVAAKVNVFNTKTKKYYFTFITVEAYNALKEWMDFRASFGEQISAESWIMRDLWQIKSQRFGNYFGLAKNPRQLSSAGIRMLINDAWKIQGVRASRLEGKKRYEFKSLHGFRKFFQTECQKVMKSINVSYLMSHDTGIVQHYYRPTEYDILTDYLKSVDLLTINEENRLKRKIDELFERQDEISLMKLKHEKELGALHEKIREEMNEQMNQIMVVLQANPALANVKSDVLMQKKKLLKIPDNS
jgi:integrase